MTEGSLYVVGTGILGIGQTTIEARECIRRSDIVLHVVQHTHIAEWIKRNSKDSHSLFGLYEEGRDRSETYDSMVEKIMKEIRAGKVVCAVFYGHPGVFVGPSHVALARARKEGFYARMLPGVSAEDCLFADLEIDPANEGCQTYEATRFLNVEPVFDRRVPLVLWQIGAVGDQSYFASGRYEGPRFSALHRRLTEIYSDDHEVVVYEAAVSPLREPRIERMPLRELSQDILTGESTLFIPAEAYSS